MPITLPYSGTGTTVGYTDDYDEACPYIGSTSLDVVYTVTPQQDRAETIDLLGSTYDTKLYVYDQDLSLVACNDDFYPDYVSRLNAVELLEGVQYFIVIDGWYTVGGTSLRDDDYFELVVPASGVIEMTADAEFGTYVFQITYCDDMSLLQYIEVGPCEPGQMTIVEEPGATVWLFITATTFEGPVNEYQYVIESKLGAVATEARSWSAVRGLYGAGGN